jgi:hypothetical protein
MECPDLQILERYAADELADAELCEHLGCCERCNWKVIEAHEWAIALRASRERSLGFEDGIVSREAPLPCNA